MKKNLTILMLTLILLSCERIKEKTKATINEGGEVVGKSATEFFEGVAEGVDKTLQSEIIFSEPLKDLGLRRGKFSIGDDTLGGINNMLTLYLIFDKALNKELLIKVYDKTGVEIGRTKLHVEGQAGDAGYFDFSFDKRTYIEVKSKITIE